MGENHPTEAVLSSTNVSKDLIHHSSRILMPAACTLNVQPPSIPVITTGDQCFPFNQAVAAVHSAKKGRLCVIGSSDIFSDVYIQKHANRELINSMFSWLMGRKTIVAPIQSPITDYKFLCDLESLCRVRLITPDSISPLRHDRDMIPDTTKPSDLLSRIAKGFPYLGLSLSDSIIKPKAVVKIPEFIPAVHPPSFYPIVKPPDIPLFDFDELLADPIIRLNRIAFDSADSDIDQFIEKARLILSPKTASDCKQFLADMVLSLL